MGAVYNRITELFSKLKDGTGNEITSTDLGGGKRGLDVNLTAPLPLPTGASTSANQATEISSLSSLDSKATTSNTNTGNTAANTANLDTKLGEVQTTPTTNTLLGRLKDIWDRLLTGVVIRDYITGDQVEVDSTNRLSTSIKTDIGKVDGQIEADNTKSFNVNLKSGYVQLKDTNDNIINISAIDNVKIALLTNIYNEIRLTNKYLAEMLEDDLNE